jgi:hypothetical protein
MSDTRRIISLMKRRTYIGAMLAGAAGASVTQAAPTQRPIQLHCDLAVDPAREQEMLSNFEKIFRPVAMKQPGYIDLKMLKLSQDIRGPAPAGGQYRFVLTFASEALRQKWIASDAHAKAWPTIENTLTDKNFGILVYDVY